MILLSATNISKTYGDKIVFNDLSISIDSDEKIGLIGINGTGKSSLLKILAGKETPDKGEVIRSNELVLEYLPQNPHFDDGLTILEQIFQGESEYMKTIREYEHLLMKMEEEVPNETTQKKFLELSGRMDALDMWQVESEAKAILTQLGISNFTQKVGTLSGGQKKRIALAGVLIRPCNLLILDEPTNHLDNDTIGYLEEILKNKKCGLIMVTHDRYFLDRVTNKITELDNSHLYSYEGNYTTFLEQKLLRESIKQKEKEKEYMLYKNELKWMQKGVEARRTKQKARKQRFFELKQNINYDKEEKLEINLSTSRLGKKIMALDQVTKKYGAKTIIENFSYVIVKEDRIGIIGKNGAGKSTLLNIMASKVTIDSGNIEMGETVKIGYYSQQNEELNENLRVIDYIKEKKEYIKMQDGTMVSASKLLEQFLFEPRMHYTPISRLSGGEKRRLYLLGVLIEDINMLLLDEPTNDIDIQTLQVLEEYIDNFDGPVVVVSHDRYFLDKISEKIFELEDNGHITNYPGNYSDYIMKKREDTSDTIKNHEKKEKETIRKQKTAKDIEKTKFTYNEKFEYETIEDEIQLLEDKLEKIQQEMHLHASSYVRLSELEKEKSEMEDMLSHKMDRWEYLSEKAAKI